MNREIPNALVRMVLDDGTNEIMHRNIALNKAEENGLDLICINAKAENPIVKMADFGKYQYQVKQQAKENAKKQRQNKVIVKEVQFKLNIDDHDFGVKLRKIESFLAKGHKVKVLVQFRGRENANRAPGFDLISRVIDMSTGIPESNPQLNANRIIAILKPKEE